MMLVVSMPFQDNLFLTYAAGCIGATVLEYVTGVTMEAIFKVRYWDYSNQKFNFQGHICLTSSLAWGGLTILMTEVLHKPVERFVLGIPSGILTVITLILTCYIVSDFTLSFQAALDLRDVLVKIEKAREELHHLQKRLDVLIAVSEDELTGRRQEKEQEIRQRLDELHKRIEERKEHLMALRYTKGVYRRSQLLGNPGMVSKRFKEALEELKEAVGEKKSREKKDEK